KSGLPRALFGVRLLEQSKTCTPRQRFSFLIGAFIACDLDALAVRGILSEKAPVAIVGNAALAHAWRASLSKASVTANVVTENETEIALLAGLNQILERRS
ncbi:MAG TPA: 2-dehydro-3-deoxygalactonokinase, partial [Bryobacteraceae bacterium]|nr:2-dehydro-3-deoxygalactonokinase [Bryobacteraceae bacterium]